MEYENVFEAESSMTKSELAEFLRKLADSVERGMIRLNIDEKMIELPLTEPVDVEIYYEEDSGELEIEFEFRRKSKIEIK